MNKTHHLKMNIDIFLSVIKINKYQEINFHQTQNFMDIKKNSYI